MAAPATLPADFFSRGSAPPDTLPADFFSKPNAEPEQPGFGAGLQRTSLAAQAVTDPINTLKEVTGANALRDGVDKLREGNWKGAALAFHSGLSHMVPGGSTIEAGTQVGKGLLEAVGKIKDKDYKGALRSFADALPIIGPELEGALKIHEGNTAEGAGMMAGPVLDAAVTAGATKGVGLKLPPGSGRAAVGTGGVAAGGVATMAGHPVIGTTLAGAGVEQIVEGIRQMRAGRTPPPLPSPPSAAELGIRANLEKLGQPDNHFQPIPQATVQPPSLPVQPAPVAVQPVVPPGTPPEVRAMAPVEPHDTGGTTVVNRQADLTSGVKPLQGLIDMLERRKSLTVGEQAMLAKAKAELGASSPPVPRGTTNVEPPPAAERAYVDADNTGLGKSQKEITNRTAKAQRFISKLGGTQNLPRTDAEWSTLAKDMGENIPSADTKELITKGLNKRMVNGQEKPGASVPSLQQQLSDSLRLANLKKSFPWETKEQLMERLKK